MMINPETTQQNSTVLYLGISTSTNWSIPSGEKLPEVKCECPCHNISKLKTALEMAAIPIIECVECRCWDRKKS